MGRFGYDDDDDEDADTPGAAVPAQPARADAPEPHELIAVQVSERGDVLGVRLNPLWTRAADPFELAARVTDEVNAAIDRSFVAAVGAVDPNTIELPAAFRPDPRYESDQELTDDDMFRLFDEVMADVSRFAETATAMAAPATAASAGGHVSVTAQQGRVASMTIHPRWSSVVRSSEVDAELLDALRKVPLAAAAAPSPADLHSPALTELVTLVSNPRSFLPRLGLPAADAARPERSA